MDMEYVEHERSADGRMECSRDVIVVLALCLISGFVLYRD